MKKFDVLIIGSGMGGLVCANILSREGYSVCMVEKNKQIGGSLQIYVRNKIIFDSGVHYLGGLDKGQNLYQIFKYLGLTDKLRIEKMSKAFDLILLDNEEKVYPVYQGYENFERELIREFPEEETAIRKYTQTIREVCDCFPLYRLRMEGDAEKKLEAMSFSARQFIDTLTENQMLREVFAGNNMLYAGAGDATPFYVHALTVNSYLESAWRCRDGGIQIARLLAQNITDAGGLMIKNREVKKLVMNNGKVSGVLLNDGTVLEADYFVSNASPAATYRMTDSDLIRPVTRNRISAMPTTVSCFILNIVLKENRFPYSGSNFYYHKKGSAWKMTDYTEAEWPLGYALYLSPGPNPEFAGGMTIFAYMRFDEVRPWKSSFNTVSLKQDRGEDYRDFKNKKAEQLLNKVEEKFPDLRQQIVQYHTATPLTFRDYIGNDDGNIYGSAKDYRNPLGTLISAKTKIPNLFLTGQYLNLHGILGTAISGLITAIALTGRDHFIEKIRNA